jgi:hypothetical protein
VLHCHQLYCSTTGTGKLSAAPSPVPTPIATAAAQTVAITQDSLLRLISIALQIFMLLGNMCYADMNNSWGVDRA